MYLNDVVENDIILKYGVSILEICLGQEIFFNISNPSALNQPDLERSFRAGAMSMQTAKLPEGEMAVFFVSKDDTRINKPFCGILLNEAIGMVKNNTSVAGMLLQSLGEKWIVIKKDAINEVRLNDTADKVRR
jgi:hypothetical protein